MILQTMLDAGREKLIRLNAFLADNPLEDPALLSLAFCYNPFDLAWLDMFTF